MGRVALTFLASKVLLLGSFPPHTSLVQQATEPVDYCRLLLAIFIKQWTVFFNQGCYRFLFQCCSIHQDANRLLSYIQLLRGTFAQRSTTTLTLVETRSFCLGHQNPCFFSSFLLLCSTCVWTRELWLCSIRAALQRSSWEQTMPLRLVARRAVSHQGREHLMIRSTNCFR